MDSTKIRTLVLIGKSGNGKSATCNSIIGKNKFKAEVSPGSVTTVVQTATSDDETVQIIDTPGVSDTNLGHEVIGKEITKCINLAPKGIHAFLLVVSVRNRFSKGQEDAINCLQDLFGSKIYDYMIVVFTGGDLMDKRLHDFICDDCPDNLKKILKLCGNRKVLFDNKTKDKSKMSEQVQILLSFVDLVLAQNEGEPYTHNKHFGGDDSEKLPAKDIGFTAYYPKEETPKSYGQQLEQITLKEIIKLSGNCMVLFDNKTKDESKKTEQVQQLLNLVTEVQEANSREPYRNRADVSKKFAPREGDFLGESSLLVEKIQKPIQEKFKQSTTQMASELWKKTRKVEDEIAAERITKLYAQKQKQEVIRRYEERMDCMYNDTIREERQRRLIVSDSYLKRVILVGKTGTGKSAAFYSIMGKITLGSTFEIINSPGLLFDNFLGYQKISKEISNHIALATNGIHAILIVLSLENQFSIEEEIAISLLRHLFGEEIFDHIIIVLTAGEDHPNEEVADDKRLKDYLSNCCQENMQKILKRCHGRTVLLDNQTINPQQNSNQVRKLLSLVEKLLIENGRTHRKGAAIKLKKRQVDFNGILSMLYPNIPNSYSKRMEALKKITEELNKQRQEVIKEIISLKNLLSINKSIVYEYDKMQYNNNIWSNRRVDIPKLNTDFLTKLSYDEYKKKITTKIIVQLEATSEQSTWETDMLSVSIQRRMTLDIMSDRLKDEIAWNQKQLQNQNSGTKSG